MSRKKEHTRLIDNYTREIVAECELTPAAVKRLIKLYREQGLWVEVA